MSKELDYIAELERENRLLGERCNQLLKDKGNLTDELQELKETLAQTIENDEVAYDTLKLHDQEENGMLNSKIAKLEQQIEKMKCCGNCKHLKHIGDCICGYYTCDKDGENEGMFYPKCNNKDKWELKNLIDKFDVD